MHLRSLVLFLLFLLSGARRSIRIDDSHHGAQQQNNTLDNGLEVSAEARDAFIPSIPIRRVGPQAGASREGSKHAGRRAGHLESHRAAPWFRFGTRRANVALQAGQGPEADQSPTAQSSVVTPALPELYVYDHCPFCVRVRLALGLKGIKHHLRFLGNDDVETPTALVGKKIAPILVDEDGIMMESLDIIAKIDKENTFAPASGRTDLKAWQKSVQSLMRKIVRPRYVMVPLPEFMQKGGRDAFVANHQLPPYEKSDWKGNPDMSLEEKYAKYKEAFAESASLIAELNEKLKELEPLIHSETSCTPDIGVSYDDIDLWSRLRSLTLIKGVELPPKVRGYLDYFEREGDVPLYDVMAV